MLKRATYLQYFFTAVFACTLYATGRAQDIGARMRDNLFLYYGEDANEKMRQNLVCVARASRTDVFAGEPVQVVYKLYSALQSVSVIERMPPFNGFSVYEMKAQPQPQPIIEMLNGKPYNAYIVRNLQLYPTEIGLFTLEPATIKNKVTFQESDEAKHGNAVIPDGYTPTDDLPGYSKIEYEYRCQSGQPVIHVMAIPETGRPQGFSGAVGKFGIAVTCKDSVVEKNGTVKVIYTLSGSGNFKMINELPVLKPAGFEMFDPVIREELDELQVPFAGKKIFEYTLSPQQEGAATVPSIQFSYFDPSSRSFHTLTTRSISLQVKPAIEKNYMRPETQQPEASSPRYQYLLYMIPAVLAIVAGALIRLRQKKKKNAQESEQDKIKEEWEKVLNGEPAIFEESSKLLYGTDARRFFIALNRELKDGVAARLQVLPSADPKRIYAMLYARNPDLALNYQKLRDELDHITYAYAQPKAPPETYYRIAREIIDALTA